MLTNTEAAALKAMKKYAVDQKEYEYPSLGVKLIVPLLSADKREEFTLDIRRGRIDLRKTTHQNRVRGCVILVRLDIAGPPHTNPDGTEIPCPHLHIYDQEYGDKWAYPVPSDAFSDMSNLSEILDDFMAYCNIVARPNIQLRLF